MDANYLTPFSTTDPMKFVFEEFKPSSIYSYSPKKPLRVFLFVSIALSNTAKAFAQLSENEKHFYLDDPPSVENFILQKTKTNFSSYFTELKNDKIGMFGRPIVLLKESLTNDSLQNQVCQTGMEAVAFYKNKLKTHKEKTIELNFIDFPDLNDEDFATVLESAKEHQITVSSLLISGGSPGITKIPEDCDQLEILMLQNLSRALIFPKRLSKLKWLISNVSDIDISKIEVPEIRRLSVISGAIWYKETILENLECRDIFHLQVAWRCEMPKLVHLRIVDCNIVTMPSLPRLEHLELNYCESKPSFIPEMTSLSSLVAKDMKLYRISSALPSLRRCEIENCDLLEEVDLDEKSLLFCRIVNSFIKSKSFDENGMRKMIQGKEAGVED